MTDDRHAPAAAWFADLRDRLCAAFEAIEDDYAGTAHADLPPGRFERRVWAREERDVDETDGGGGVMAIMKGRVFEKVGVNISTVHGRLSPEFRRQIPGAAETGRFRASGVSLVAHLRSPLVPAAHMNTRHIVTGKSWFGGGADLTPMFPDESAAADFHAGLKSACDACDPGYYPRFRDWCDQYFYLPHRNEPRGAGGIFYDQLDTEDWEADFAFTRKVGEAFLATYPAIVRQRMNAPWTAEQREHQLIRRGRYVEFNLLYDRGTTFGLKTGGHVDAILMSLPPEVKWP